MRIGYARVSTADQNTDLQLDALKGDGCEAVYIDKLSGATKERPELAAVLKALRKGDTLVVWKLDRLARNLDDLRAMVKDLEAREIEFRSIRDQIDTSGAAGRLVFNLFASLAEFERDMIRERTMAGLAAARKRGKVGGRPPKVSDKAMRQARAMLADENNTVEDVAKRLHIAPSTLYRHLPPGGRSALTEQQNAAPL